MAATSLWSVLTLPPRCLSGKLSHRKAPFGRPNLLAASSSTTATNTSFIFASKRDSYGDHYNGKLVDESMIVLRMRMHDIELKNKKNEAPNSDWMEWEKMYLADYGSDICEAVGLLQRLLMNTRPCLALAMLALLTLSMLMSFSLIVFHLVELVK